MSRSHDRDTLIEAMLHELQDHYLTIGDWVWILPNTLYFCNPKSVFFSAIHLAFGSSTDDPVCQFYVSLTDPTRAGWRDDEIPAGQHQYSILSGPQKDYMISSGSYRLSDPLSLPNLYRSLDAIILAKPPEIMAMTSSMWFRRLGELIGA